MSCRHSPSIFDARPCLALSSSYELVIFTLRSEVHHEWAMEMMTWESGD